MWEVLEFVELASFRRPWMLTHAQLPTPLPLGGDLVRVFFASRDLRQYSHVGYVDLLFDVASSSIAVTDVCPEPVLAPGPIGFFDEHGVFPSCIVPYEGRLLLYFIGWNKGSEAPLFYASIGMAESLDGRKFTRVSPAPLFSRSAVDPCLVTSPHVFRDGDTWRMTYVSGFEWYRDEVGYLRSRYDIKSAVGSDPFEWSRCGSVAVGLQNGETNVARSSVVKLTNNKYAMWFSYVHRDVGKYRIGYAESTDAVTWSRDDQRSGVDRLPSFASEMMCYPSVFLLSGAMFMLFNGNNFGAEGFGIARWIDR